MTTPGNSDATPPRAEEIQAWLVAHLAELGGVDPRSIDTGERFSRYGLESLKAMGLFAKLSYWLGRPLSPTLAWEYPTIAALTRYLLEGAGGSPAGERAQVRRPREGEPIAIVGIACRFPKAASPEAFWRLLRDGVDATTEVPKERWDLDAFYNADPGAPGKMRTRRGAFLDRVDGFDPLFFGVSPREAHEMDPQQRLALELVWEALEDAGIPPKGLEGSRTGVFVGAMWRDYADLARGQLERMNAHRATGQAINMIANRVSYVLGLRGPSVMVDTACSSALVGVHFACQSLWYGDATLALAGGVNLLLAPETMVYVSQFGGLSPDGRCKAFDARADGFGRGEGGGMIVLKLLSRAVADGDPIHGVIRATAVNNDGFSHGLTAPSVKAQEELLREAYRRAGVQEDRVHYVEAHGTGTILGDPIEAKALGAVLGAGRAADRPLILGSVKTNIGHPEGAAGIAGLIKTLLAMKHREIPPSLHFEHPNPHIAFEELRLRVARAATPWPAPDEEPALAGVSSFGWGGTNAHVVLEGPPADPQWIALSADSHAALTALAGDLGSSVLQRTLAEVSSEASTRSSGHDHRLAITARSREEAAEQLGAFARGEPRAGLVHGRAPFGRRKVVFVCSPLGSQWVGMGRRLMGSEPSFRAALERCDRELSPYTGWSLLDELGRDEPGDHFDDVILVQPILFAVQVALAAQWRAWGIEPDVVVGHSAGEVAAAHIAGILDLADAARVIHHYSRVQAPMANQGAMGLVDLPASELLEPLGEHGGRVVIAGYNSRGSTVLSGEAAGVRAVLSTLKGRGVPCTTIRVNVAGHSPQMAPLLGELEQALRGIRPRRPSIPMISTVTGRALEGPEVGASYFSRNLGEPVRLAEVTERLLEEGVDVFVELGPHPVLTYALQQSIKLSGREVLVLPSLRRAEDERLTLFDTRGQLHTLGVPAQAIQPLVPGEEGTPSHAAADPEPGGAPAGLHPAELFVLSARSPEALRDLARSTSSHVADRPELSLQDLCYTAGVRRSHHEHRLAVVARSREELCGALDASLRGEASPGVAQGSVTQGSRPKVVLVFPGQGSQWLGMGRRLLEAEPVFRAAIEDCEQALRPQVGWSLLAELGAKEASSRLGEIDVVQPVLWAIQVALSALWRSWGIEPAAVVGHSIGKVAAAHVAGALSLEDAARVIARRSRIARQHASGKGAMAVVELSFEEAERMTAGLEDRLSVGVSNGPRSSVLSGDPAALEQVLRELRRRDVFCRPVKVDYASHSPQMDPLKPLLLEALKAVAPRPAEVPFYSTVTAGFLGGERLDAAYWAANLREPVRFARAVQELREAGHEVFIEVSPHPVLLPAIEDGLRHLGEGGAALASLRRDEDERACLLRTLSALYARGAPPDFARLHPQGGRVVALPMYPWQRERYWIEPAPAESPSNRAPRALPRGAVGGEPWNHPLLGAPFSSPAHPGARFWEGALCPEALPYLSDHRVEDAIVLPAAACIEMALAAARQAHGAGPHTLEDVAFREALVFSGGEARTAHFVLSDQEPGLPASPSAPSPGPAGGPATASFQLFSRGHGDASAADSWTLHASGRIRVSTEPSPPPPSEAPEGIQRRAAAEISGEAYYEALAAWGLLYGPSFRGVKRVWSGVDEAVSLVRLPEALAPEAGAYALHPALLDAALHASLAPLLALDPGGPFVPVHIRHLRVHRPAAGEVWSHAQLRPGAGEGASSFEADVRLLDATGQVLVEVLGLRLHRLAKAPSPRESDDEALLALEWQRAEAPRSQHGAAAKKRGSWLLLADEGGVAAEVQSLLEERGESVVRAVRAGGARPAGEGSLVVDPASPEAFDALLRGAFGDGEPCRGVVHLWSLETAAADEAQTPEAPDAALLDGCVSALHLVQALTRTRWRDAPRLWLVTRGAQAAGADRTAPVAAFQAPLWGLGQTLTYEHPELYCTRIDLSPGGLAAEARALVEELGAAPGEEQVALRPEGRYVARLVRRAAAGAVAPAAPRPLRSDGAYLITGGLGGLGLSLGRWLVERGARHLVLVGRRGATEPAQLDAIAAMEAAGAQVIVARADVADRAELARVLDDVRARMPPLRGVIHAAGVLEDGLVAQQDRERFRRVMAPKVQGAWNLHTLTLTEAEGLPLDFFVLYSSVASLLGSPGQSNYAAANAFLDALAHLRKARGLPALSINWGNFAGVGLAAAEERRGARLAQRGMGPLRAERAHALLGRLLGGDAAQIGVAPLDLRQWIEFYPVVASSPLFSTLPREPARGQGAHGGVPSQRDAVVTAAPEDRSRLMEQIVQEQVTTVLRIEPSRVHRSTNLMSLGVDSLTGLELRNRLEIRLELKLSSTLIWTYPRLDALAGHLLDLLGLPPEGGRGAKSKDEIEAAQLHEGLKALSDEALFAALAEELASSGDESEEG